MAEGLNLNRGTATLRPTWDAFKDFHKFYKKCEDLQLDAICGTLRVIPPREWKKPATENYAKDVLGDIVIDKPLKQTFLEISEGVWICFTDLENKSSVSAWQSKVPKSPEVSMLVTDDQYEKAFFNSLPKTVTECSKPKKGKMSEPLEPKPNVAYYAYDVESTLMNTTHW